jgi:uncharacterized membrane protein
MMKKMGMMVLSFLAIAGLAFAFPFTANVKGPQSFSMLEGMTLTASLEVSNLDFEEHDITVTATSDSPFVKAKPVLKKFTLNGYESTLVGVDITSTDDAQHDTYEIMVKVNADGQVTNVPIPVYVGSNPFFTIGTFDKSVCASEYVEDISVSIKNISGKDTSVSIHGEQSILFPAFDEESVELDIGKTQILSLQLNVSPQNVGDYTGTVLIENDDIIVARPFSVSVKDCPILPEKTISLTLPKKPKDLTKLQTTLFPITLKNVTKTKQEVDVFVSSVIPITPISLTLGPFETLTVDLMVKPNLSTPAGTHAVEITATASGYSTFQSTTMKVLPVDYIEAESATTIYEIVKGQTKSLSFVVHNKGDLSQTVSFGMQSGIPGVDFSFSSDSATITAGKSAVITLSVSVESDAPIVSVNNEILVNGTPVRTIPLSFDVLSPTSTIVSIIEVVSAPEAFTLGAGEKKEFDVIVENPTDASILGIHYKLVGVKGSGLVLIAEQNETVAPHQTKTLHFTLVAGNQTNAGAYSPILVMESPNASTSVSFTVIVEQRGFLSGLTGLVPFAGEKAAAIGLVVVLVLIGWWIFSKFTPKTPAWVSK